MATRFYLPASGTPPLSSLAVDAGWTRSDNLERRPCFTTKTDTSLTQKSATWATTSSASWGWIQFQSKPLTAAYDWTTTDTVSMVIKVAEAAAQVDSHLAYVIRVVSGDGSVVRGTIGAYRTTSTEYPTTLGAIATRIHNARTGGATNFSSQVGDRIIIELGHWGVTPTLNVVYHNYGDPSATADYALTEGLTTDLCPWVELSRTVAFDYAASDSQLAFVKGTVNASATPKPAYMGGGVLTLDSQLAYTQGGAAATPASDFQPAYAKGQADATPSSNIAFTAGALSSLSQINAYIRGSLVDTASKNAFTIGSIFINDLQNAYTEGFSTGGDTSGSHNAFVLGLDNGLIPDGDVIVSGLWWNELNSPNNLYASIDEYPTANDNDYIWDTNPTTGHYYETTLTNPAGNVGAGDVVVFWRGKDKSGSGKSQATVMLKQGSTVIASGVQILTSIPTTYYFTLTPAQKSNITDWNDLRVRITIIIL